MKHYQDFRITGETFRERVGSPEEFDAALGRIVLGFSYLEDSLRNVICLLLGGDIRTGVIASAELGFRQKLDLMGSLFWHRMATLSLSHQASVEDRFREVLILCRRSEELRNQHLHSRYSRLARAKTTAKASKGLRTKIETTSPDILLDVADFIVYTAMSVEEFPLSLGIATGVGGNDDSVEYSLKGERIAFFKFGDD